MLQPWIPDPPAEPVPSDGGLSPEWIAEVADKEPPSWWPLVEPEHWS